MEKYQHVRFRWWNQVDLDKAREELGAFKPSVKQLPTGGFDLYKDDKRELTAASDTLVAHLSGFRAVLTQKEAKPFTRRDAELREKIIQLYPQNRPTPFPWEWSPEPKFQVEE